MLPILLAPRLAPKNEKPYKHNVYRVFCGERGKH